MNQKKYELTDKTLTCAGVQLHRIRALYSFGRVVSGALGGYVQGEHNLSHDDGCWLYGDAKVYENAQVSGNAGLFNNARVFGNALVCGNARVIDDARVFGNARVFGDNLVYGNANELGCEEQ